MYMKGIGLRNAFPPTGLMKKEEKKKGKSATDYDEMLGRLGWGREHEVYRIKNIIGRAQIRQGGLIIITGGRGYVSRISRDSPLVE